MLRRERVDLVVVRTVDGTHNHYIVQALEAGCDVVTEKPMTTDADRARRILDAQRRTGREVRVAFNYRCNPVHATVRETIAAGEVGSVHFEWLLGLRHGADYFRRRHREKADSGGPMVHKAGGRRRRRGTLAGDRAGREPVLRVGRSGADWGPDRHLTFPGPLADEFRCAGGSIPAQRDEWRARWARRTRIR
ncbi:Gfo/Idh/MocA family oxidoreductase [Streptomyces sp. Li-HN-5-13]|nr:Gfo/Idh/MocA family oxidoreductase [Streptomyces sp. Li-HN-5-13]